MKHTFLATLFSLTALTFLTGCTGQMASVGLSEADKEQECHMIDKKLVKVDTFLEVLNSNSSFHMEEVAQIGYAPNITSSNNKPRMIKDGKQKRESLLEERQKLGCEPLEK